MENELIELNRAKQKMASTLSNGKMDITPQEDKPFRLLDLPPEIWSEISHIAIVDIDSLPQDTIFPYTAKRAEEQLEQPGITRVCKILRAETLPIFYSNCHMFVREFAFRNNSILMKWLEHIGPTNRRHLTDLTMSSCYVDAAETWRRLLKPLGLGVHLVTKDLNEDIDEDTVNGPESEIEYVEFRNYAIIPL